MHKLMTLAAALTVSAMAGNTPAATLYWDTNGATAGVGGTGTWDTSTTANWSTVAAGNVTTGLWNQVGGQDIAYIPNVSTVTVSGTVNANQVQLEGAAAIGVTDFTVQGGTINMTGASPTIMRLNAPGGLNGTRTFSSNLTGSNGLTYSGNGDIDIAGNNSYTGTTVLNMTGRLDLLSVNAIPATSLVNAAIGIPRIRPGASGITFAGLTGTASVQGQGGGGAILNLDSSSASPISYTGAFGGPRINIVKKGSYTQVLGGTGANAFSAAPTVSVQAGTLALAKTAGVDAIQDAAITLTGGSLRLDANNQINNSADMTLSGGTFNLNGKSETLDVASLTANSILDFGTLAGNSTLLFSSLTRTGGILTVANWDGMFLPGGGGNDQFRVTSLPSMTVLSNIQFSPTAVYPVGFLPGARAINFGTYFELVPTIPEPAGLAILGLGALIPLARRRK